MKILDSQGPTFGPGDRCIWFCNRQGSSSRRQRILVEVLEVYTKKTRVREIHTGRETVVMTENLMQRR